MKRLILASQSPRRKELLGELVGQETFECIPSLADEEWNDTDIDSAVLQIAFAKAKEVYASHREQWILSADTIVVDQDQILGKPKDLEEARQTLNRLSNHWHEVKTAVILIPPHSMQQPIQKAAVTTQVHFRKLLSEEIENYVASGSPLDKAGSYGIQEVDFVDEIKGSFTNVIGLPMELVERWLGNDFMIRQSAQEIEGNYKK